MSERQASTSSHLRLVPAVAHDDPRASARAEHPSSQPMLEPVQEIVFQWTGLVEHERVHTPCCQQSIEVTNLVGERNQITNDVVAALSMALHGWDGWDVMVSLVVTPPSMTQE